MSAVGYINNISHLKDWFYEKSAYSFRLYDGFLYENNKVTRIVSRWDKDGTKDESWQLLKSSIERVAKIGAEFTIQTHERGKSNSGLEFTRFKLDENSPSMGNKNGIAGYQSVNPMIAAAGGSDAYVKQQIAQFKKEYIQQEEIRKMREEMDEIKQRQYNRQYPSSWDKFKDNLANTPPSELMDQAGVMMMNLFVMYQNAVNGIPMPPMPNIAGAATEPSQPVQQSDEELETEDKLVDEVLDELKKHGKLSDLLPKIKNGLTNTIMVKMIKNMPTQQPQGSTNTDQ